MNHYRIKHIRRIVFIGTLLFCMCASVALAGNATYALVNAVTLNAENPYWKNGDAPASETDWNAYFDTSTSTPTLRLKDAIINKLNASDELLYADGDLVLELYGANTLACPMGYYDDPACIVVYGNLIIRDSSADGTARMDISIEETDQHVYDVADGILTFLDLIIESGTIDVNVSGAAEGEGLFAYIGDVYIHGGETTIEIAGMDVSGVAGYTFNMTGGTITALTEGVHPMSAALEFTDVLVTGGEGTFIGDNNGLGAVWWLWSASGSFRVVSGRMIFASNNNAALFFQTDQTVIPDIAGSILVSTEPTGNGKFLWDSSKGVLATNDVEESEFSYVELMGIDPLSPQTGDLSKPQLWWMIGLAALLAGAGALVLQRRKRHA